MTLGTTKSSHGLNCPNCQNGVDVREGERIVACPACDQRLFVAGDNGIRRWQVGRRVEREQAREAVVGYFSGMDRARDLKRAAEINELFLVYLPYWRVRAMVAGWIFGRERVNKDKTRPVEQEIFEEMHWNDAAVDVSEFGVHRITIHHDQLEPFDSQELHAEAMVFEPTEARDDAMSEAEGYFASIARRKKSLNQVYQETIHLLRKQLSIIYYPLWVARYQYKERNYQVVVDGVSGSVLYGKAPGNIWYRALALVGGMAAGNFILVNGTAIALRILTAASDSDGALFLLLLPLGIGGALMVGGYRTFRYSEEIETLQKENRKAFRKRGKQPQNLLTGGLSMLGDMSEFDLSELLD